MDLDGKAKEVRAQAITPIVINAKNARQLKFMQLIRELSHSFKGSVVTIGNFDGVHQGHQKLIAALLSASATLQLPSVLLTFSPHPTELFSPEKSAAKLMRFSEKWVTLLPYEIDYFYEMRFTKTFAALSPEDFVKTILVDKLGAKKVIVGDDFRFGANRAGDVALLTALGERYGFAVMALPQALYQQERISSTRIREALHQGDFDIAKKLLGRPFTLMGRVAYGSQIGRTLGFPTANIHLRRKAVPLMGIFVVTVEGLADHPLPGVASIGYRPTFNGKEILLEVFLFDFTQMIYGKRIMVTFLHKIRNELKFESVDELIVQMQQDVVSAKQFFGGSN